MARTPASVCSRALVNLGAQPISSLEGGGDVPAMLSLVYPEIKATIAGLYPWECLKRRVKATRESGSPEGYKYSFVIPGDATGTIYSVYSAQDDKRGTRDYEIRQRRVVTDHPEIWVEYSVALDEAQWPSWYANLVMAAVCAEIAFTITDQQSTKDHWETKTYGTPSENRVGGLMGECQIIDAQSSGNVGFEDSAFVAARVGAWPGEY